MRLNSCLLFLALGIAMPALAETQVNVVGLFNGKAVLIINRGAPKTLSVGQIVDGVKLVEASSSKAVLEIEGKRRELGMGQAATIASAANAAAGSATLYADSAGHYFSDGQINGVPLRFLVDTGATSVVMNSGDAKFANIDYKKGQSIQIQTASGIAIGYLIVINSLRLGSLVMNQVDGVVIEGGSPSVVLMGMSALNRLEMKRENIALTLTKKY
jgi:aspartyl protease family protein